MMYEQMWDAKNTHLFSVRCYNSNIRQAKGEFVT